MRRRILSYAASFVVFALALTALFAEYAHAASYANVDHTPPDVVLGEVPEFSIAGTGIKRARMLIAGRDGYRVVDMSGEGQRFVAKTEFGDLAVLKYQFQLEMLDGRLLASKYFTVRQPSGDEVEKEIVSLSKEAEVLRARISQIENAVHSLKNTDPAVLGRRKKKELAKAYILLGKRERELEEATLATAAEFELYNQQLRRSLKGKSVLQGRRLLSDEGGNNAAW